MACDDLDLPVFTPVCNQPYLKCTGYRNLILMNTIWQKRWDVTFEVSLQKDCGFHLVVPLYFLRKPDVTWAVSGKGSHGRKQRGFWPTSREDLRPSVNSPWRAKSCKEPHELGSIYSPHGASRWDHSPCWYCDCGLIRVLEAEGHSWASPRFLIQFCGHL